MRAAGRAAIWICAALCAGASGASGQDRSVFVSRDALNCIIAHAADYGSIDNDPMLIRPDRCPDPQPNRDVIASLSSNSSLPVLQSGQVEPQPDKLLSLTKADLVCLSSAEAVAEIDGLTGDLIDLSQTRCF